MRTVRRSHAVRHAGADVVKAVGPQARGRVEGLPSVLAGAVGLEGYLPAFSVNSFSRDFSGDWDVHWKFDSGFEP